MPSLDFAMSSWAFAATNRLAQQSAFAFAIACKRDQNFRTGAIIHTHSVLLSINVCVLPQQSMRGRVVKHELAV